jgi:hypothetical protein
MEDERFKHIPLLNLHEVVRRIHSNEVKQEDPVNGEKISFKAYFATLPLVERALVVYGGSRERLLLPEVSNLPLLNTFTVVGRNSIEKCLYVAGEHTLSEGAATHISIQVPKNCTVLYLHDRLRLDCESILHYSGLELLPRKR